MKSVLVLLCLSVSISCYCQSTLSYKVFKTENNVTIKRKGNTSLAISGMILSPTDSVILEKDSYLSFYNTNDNRRYEIKAPGCYVIDNAVISQQGRRISYFSILKRRWENFYKPTITDKGMVYYDRTYSKQYSETEIAQLLHYLINGSKEEHIDATHVFLQKKHLPNNNEFCFEIRNYCSTDLFVGVFKLNEIDRINDISWLFYDGIDECNIREIAAIDSTNMIGTGAIFVPAEYYKRSDCVFVDDGSFFILVGANYPFSPQIIENFYNECLRDTTYCLDGAYKGLVFKIIK